MVSIIQKMGIALQNIFLISFVGFSILLSQTTTALGAMITDIRLWSAPDHTRIVLHLTEPLRYESSSQEKPPQFFLELEGISFPRLKRMTEVKDPFLTKMSLTELGKDKVKLTLYQKKPLRAHVFLLKPYQDKPHRLVVDLVAVSLEKKEIEERRKQKEIRPKGTKIVVIDPGHGGEDPGAIGPKKTREQDIVLKVGEKAIYLLNQHKEVK